MSVNNSYALFPSELSRYLMAQLEVNICDYDLFFSEGVISTDIIVRDILSNRSPIFDSLYVGTPAEVTLSTSCKNRHEMIEKELAE